MNFKYNRFSKKQLEAIASEFLESNAKRSGCKILIEEMLEAYGYDIFPIAGLNQFAEAIFQESPAFFLLTKISSFRTRYGIGSQLPKSLHIV